MLEVLMYVFQQYMDGKAHLNCDMDILEQILVQKGFDEEDVQHALKWLSRLRKKETYVPAGADSFRVYTDYEPYLLDLECQGMLWFLQEVGILDSAAREQVIARAQELDVPVTLGRLQWVVLMVLYHQPQQPHLKQMEDLVLHNDSVH